VSNESRSIFDQDLGTVAAGPGPTLGREVFDELAPGCTVGLVDAGPVVGTERRRVDHEGAGLVTAQPSRCAQPIEGSFEELAVELRDLEPTGPGSVAVVVQRQVRLGLSGPRLPAEQDRLMPVGEVEVDTGEHPAGGLPQPLGVHRAATSVADPGGLADQPLLRLPDLLGGGLGGRLLSGVHDHAYLLRPDLAGRERRTSNRVLLLQQAGDP
jgi:hypothetical protein